MNIRGPRKDRIVAGMKVRSGNVEVKTGRRPHERRHEVPDPITETESACWLPGAPALAVRDHHQHEPNGWHRESSGLEDSELHPDDAVRWRGWISCLHPQPGQVHSLKKRVLHDLVIALAA